MAGLRACVRVWQGYPARRPEHRQPPLQAAAQAGGFAKHKVARSQAHLRYPPARAGDAPHLRPEVARTRIGAANPRPLLPLDAEHGPQHRRRDRRSSRLDLLSREWIVPLAGNGLYQWQNQLLGRTSRIVAKHGSRKAFRMTVLILVVWLRFPRDPLAHHIRYATSEASDGQTHIRRPEVTAFGVQTT